MSNAVRNLIYVIVGVIAGMILIFAKFKLTIPIDSITAIVITTSAICIITLVFVFYIAVKNSRDIPFPLGLTSGSVRALIAVLVLMFFICLALIFYFSPSCPTCDPKEKTDLAKSILTTLGTLVIAVSSFYYGSKATEQGSQIASAAIDKVLKTQAAGTENLITSDATKIQNADKTSNDTITQSTAQNNSEEEQPVEIDVDKKSEDNE